MGLNIHHLERSSRRSSALCSTMSSVLLKASRSSCDEPAAAVGPLLSGGRSTVASGATPLPASSTSLQANDTLLGALCGKTIRRRTCHNA